MKPLGPELSLAMSLALETSEGDIRAACTLLEDMKNVCASRDLAVQLLGRARRRVETVRTALGGAAEAHRAREDA